MISICLCQTYGISICIAESSVHDLHGPPPTMTYNLVIDDIYLSTDDRRHYHSTILYLHFTTTEMEFYDLFNPIPLCHLYPHLVCHLYPAHPLKLTSTQWTTSFPGPLHRKWQRCEPSRSPKHLPGKTHYGPPLCEILNNILKHCV